MRHSIPLLSVYRSMTNSSLIISVRLTLDICILDVCWYLRGRYCGYVCVCVFSVSCFGSLVLVVSGQRALKDLPLFKVKV